jgi:hypothetical protein
VEAAAGEPATVDQGICRNNMSSHILRALQIVKTVHGLCMEERTLGTDPDSCAGPSMLIL